jgi:hypothetical protein
MILGKNRKKEFDEMPLQKSLKWLEEFTDYFAYAISELKKLNYEFVIEINDLISEETIKRYRSISKTLKYPYCNFKEENFSKELEQGFLVQSWSNLGSLLESTLQMFLAFYYRDYTKSTWGTWDSKIIEAINLIVSTDFNDKLKEMVNDETIEFKGSDRKSFLDKVKYIIKEKEQLPRIDRLTLEPLIGFYFSENVMDWKHYSVEELRKIRDYRNSIHSFQEREIGTWNEFNHYVKILITLIIDMINRLPDLPDDVPWDTNFYEGRANLLMQEQKWFEFTLTLNDQ